MLNYSDGPNLFTRVLIRGKQDNQNQSKRCDDRSRGCGQREI